MCKKLFPGLGNRYATIRYLHTTQVLDFVHHLLFKNTKTELSIDPLEMIIAHLFDELN